MKKFLVVCALLLVLTGCSKRADDPAPRSREYTFYASCDGFSLTFTPHSVTVTDDGGTLGAPVSFDTDSGTLTYGGVSLPYDPSVPSPLSLGLLLRDFCAGQTDGVFSEPHTFTGTYLGTPFTVTTAGGDPTHITWGSVSASLRTQR